MIDPKPWIEHLKHPAVLVGFALFVFASTALMVLGQGKEGLSPSQWAVVFMLFALAVIAIIAAVRLAQDKQSYSRSSANQSTQGSQGPAIRSAGDANIIQAGGDVNISTIPQAITDRLLKNLEEKDDAILEREEKHQELLQNMRSGYMRSGSMRSGSNQAAFCVRGRTKLTY